MIDLVKQELDYDKDFNSSKTIKRQTDKLEYENMIEEKLEETPFEYYYNIFCVKCEGLNYAAKCLVNNKYDGRDEQNLHCMKSCMEMRKFLRTLD